MSRMDVLEDDELKDLIDGSKLVRKYNEELDRSSAYEMLNEKIEIANREEAKEKSRMEQEAASKSTSRRQTSSRRRTSKSSLEKVLTSPTVIRSVLGILTKMLK